MIQHLKKFLLKVWEFDFFFFFPTWYFQPKRKVSTNKRTYLRNILHFVWHFFSGESSGGLLFLRPVEATIVTAAGLFWSWSSSMLWMVPSQSKEWPRRGLSWSSDDEKRPGLQDAPCVRVHQLDKSLFFDNRVQGVILAGALIKTYYWIIPNKEDFQVNPRTTQLSESFDGAFDISH